MKNLTLKKVALGIFLAGYAASGAFALSTTTSTTIIGTKPLITDAAGAAITEATQKFDIDYYKEDGVTSFTPNSTTDKLKVDQYIAVKYKLQDDEDDDEQTGTNAETAKTLVFFYIDKNNALQTVPAAQLTVTKGEVKWKIPAAADGAKQVGVKLQGNTQYGAPKAGDWLSADDITSTASPDNNGSTDPGNPKPGGPGGNNGTGPTPTNPIQPSTTTRIGIFAETAIGTIAATSYNYAPMSGMTDNPTPGATDVLKVGNKYYAYVWQEKGGKNHAPDDGTDVDLTSSKTFTWRLSGTNTAASTNNQNAASTNLTAAQGVNGNEFEIKPNGQYPTYDAGAQGFKLYVEAN